MRYIFCNSFGILKLAASDYVKRHQSEQKVDEHGLIILNMHVILTTGSWRFANNNKSMN